MREARQTSATTSLRRFRPYQEYRDSGVEWLGEIPAHWGAKRLKYVAPISDERLYEVGGDQPYVALEHIESGTGKLAAEIADDPPESTAAAFRPGDVLFGKLRPYLAKVLRPEFAGACSTELLVLRSTGEVDPPFLAYQLLSPSFIRWINSMTFGTKMPRARPEQVSTTPVAVPPELEQRAIAQFLDRETGMIDAMVAKKERLIELLQEKRTALITRAVTKGLDPNAPMKDSGVEWLGEIPAHWEVAPVYARYEVALGKMLDAKRISGECPGRYIRNIDVQWDAVNTDDLPEMDFAPWEHDRYLLRPDDLLVCEGGEVGRTAMWHGESEECFYQKAVHRVRPRSVQEVPRLFYYLMYSLAKRGVFVAGGNPNTIDHLTEVQLRHYRFPFPPSHEQRAIAAFLDREAAKIDALIAKTRDGIDLLKEYRTSLISAAVTGKIDVRKEAA